MRKVMLFLAVIGLAGSLWAADPLIGTWKLNIEKSKFPPAKATLFDLTAPREQTEVYRELNSGQIELTFKNIDGEGSSILTVMTYPIQGGAAKIQEGDTSISFIQTRIAQDEWYATYLLDGKQIRTRHKKISKDRKTLRQTVRGFDDEGKPYEMLLVLEKQ